MADLTTSLSGEHIRELVESSAIDPEVIAERGYVTVGRPRASLPGPSGQDTRDQLKAMGFPSWAIREDYYFPGLLIPQYSPSGTRYAGQFKPFRAVPNREGKPQRYASAKGPARLDVHPRWSVLGQELVPPIVDVDRPLWITEGVKKADALTSRGMVTVALNGVYNWRNTHATLGDWEDVKIKGREIVLCFDADAVTKAAVAQAMARLGKWLKHKGATKIWYLTVPPLDTGVAKGVDDYLAAGGTLKGLQQAMELSPPAVVDTEDRFTDARLAETLATDALEESYVWAAGLDWLKFDGRVWTEVHEVATLETVRQWALARFQEAAARLKTDDKRAAAEVDGWRGLLSAARASAVLRLARGVLHQDAGVFDADADHVNTPTGYLELETGKTRALGEGEYPTRVTGVGLDVDTRSEVWEAFLERILPDVEVRGFVQRLFGYALLGEVREHVMPIFTGEGANGKGTLRDAVLTAFGSYGLEVDPELLMSSNNPRHLTFLMELKGRRLVFCSETEKHRRFAEAAMKRLVGGDPIQANKMRHDPITFLPTHTLVMCTNHLPRVSGDDPAVWRRLLVVPFDVVIPAAERDPRLPGRLKEPDVQRAVFAWLYEGYQQYAVEGLRAPEAVQMRTLQYQVESDAVGRFIAERTDREPAARVTLGEVYAAYLAWFRDEAKKDELPLSKRELSAALAGKGWTIAKSDGVMIIRGMALTASEQ